MYQFIEIHHGNVSVQVLTMLCKS